MPNFRVLEIDTVGRVHGSAPFDGGQGFKRSRANKPIAGLGSASRRAHAMHDANTVLWAPYVVIPALHMVGSAET